MSHFTVLVALPATMSRAGLDGALATALAPFDENTDVEPYRKYEDGGPEDHWFVASMRRGARHHREGTGILPYKPDEIGWSSASSKKTPDQQRAKFAEDARWAERLGASPSWPHVIALLRERYTYDEDLFYDPATDRAYTMSTYNPRSKWDWYSIGGRWRGYFPVAPKAKAADLVVTDPRYPEIEGERQDGRCDGGRKRALRLDELRAQKAREAQDEWDAYAAVIFGTPEAVPWRVFAERIDKSGNSGYSAADARRDYGEQERVKAIRTSEEFGRSWSDPHTEIEPYTREEYKARATLRAVPGYATLDATLDGVWMAPGKMGWFGASSDDEVSYADYVAKANSYVDGLPDDVWLVLVDCHI